MNQEIIDNKLLAIIKKITNLNNERLYSVYQFEDWGLVEILIGRGFVNLSKNEVTIGLNASVRVTLVENYWDDFAEELNLKIKTLPHIFITDKLKELEGPSTFGFGPPKFLIKGIHFQNDEEKRSFSHFPLTDDGFQQLEEKYTWIYHDLFLPKLKETLDIKFLDSTINDKVEYLGGSSDDYFLNLAGMQFRRMVLAKLNGNPLYEDICDWNRHVCDKIDAIPTENQNAFHKNFRKVFEVVYERLKPVQPLKETKLILNLS